MQIGGFRTIATTSPGAMKPASDPAARREQVTDSLRDARQENKALAKARLERAKQFLAMLKRWSFPPDVIARQAAKLELETGSALQQHLSAADSADAGTISVNAVSNAAPAPFAAVGREEAGGALPTGSFVEKAYLEAMDGSGEPGRFSVEDRKTVAEFEAVLRAIRALLEKAERETERMDATPDDEAAALVTTRPDPYPGAD